MELQVIGVGFNDKPIELKATCGHVDPLGYFAGTVCGKCAKAGHAKAVGK